MFLKVRLSVLASLRSLEVCNRSMEASKKHTCQQGKIRRKTREEKSPNGNEATGTTVPSDVDCEVDLSDLETE